MIDPHTSINISLLMRHETSDKCPQSPGQYPGVVRNSAKSLSISVNQEDSCNG